MLKALMFYSIRHQRVTSAEFPTAIRERLLREQSLGMISNGHPLKTKLIMNKKEIAQQFTKQMLDPNQPSINFEQVTNMLKEIEQTHSKIMDNTEAYRIQHRILESLYSGLHSKLQDLRKPIENLEERLTTSSVRLSKFQKS